MYLIRRIDLNKCIFTVYDYVQWTTHHEVCSFVVPPHHTRNTRRWDVVSSVELDSVFKVSRWVRAGRSGYCAESCWIAVLLCNSLPLSPFQFYFSAPILPFEKLSLLLPQISPKFLSKNLLLFSFSLLSFSLSYFSSISPFLFFSNICCTIRVSQRIYLNKSFHVLIFFFWYQRYPS